MQFLAQKPVRPGVQFNGIGPLGLPDASPGYEIEGIVSTTVGLITIFAGLWFIFQLFIGTFNWISAGSDKSALEKAQKRITNAIIGFFLVIFAYGLTAIVGLIFGIDILKAGAILDTLRPK